MNETLFQDAVTPNMGGGFYSRLLPILQTAVLQVQPTWGQEPAHCSRDGQHDQTYAGNGAHGRKLQ